MSDRNIAILGLIMSIVSCTLLADWQSIPHDKCVDFSPFHNPKLTIRNDSNFTYFTESMYANAQNVDKFESEILNCKLGSSLDYKECVLEKKVAVDKAYSTYNCTLTRDEVHYKCTSLPTRVNVMDNEFAGIQSLRLLNNTLYYKMMRQCETTTFKGHKCHWIPNSIVTHQYCHDCQPICRSPQYSLNFIQFSLGAAILMLSIPVAWIPVASLVSKRVNGDMQV